MHLLKLSEARARLDELVAQAAGGEDVVFAGSDGAAFKIVPVKLEKPSPKFGSARGLIEIADDFDAPLDDFDSYGVERYWSEAP